MNALCRLVNPVIAFVAAFLRIICSRQNLLLQSMAVIESFPTERKKFHVHHGRMQCFGARILAVDRDFAPNIQSPALTSTCPIAEEIRFDAAYFGGHSAMTGKGFLTILAVVTVVWRWLSKRRTRLKLSMIEFGGRWA